jgi:peptidoglycan/xylan/chitin deacetylase (PgdA/CDA1 family)/SAM-dependent methyltransferase
MIPVVIVAGRNGSLAVVRTADSVARQTVSTAIVLSVSTGTHGPIGASLGSRHGADIAPADSEAAAINAAVQRTASDRLLLVRAPWQLDPVMAERSTRILDSQPDVAVVVPALRLQTAADSHSRIVASSVLLPALLASPLETPPVFMIRRQTWDSAGGLEECFGSLAFNEWWLRLLDAGAPIAHVEEPLGSLTAGPRDWWPALSDEALDVVRFRAILEKHRPLLLRNAQELVIEQEVAFARLTSAHREALRQRDRNLAELDRLRAETAHHRAYLDHHGHGAVDWGDFKRADPISRDWGYDRGTPIDRYYIEDFLAACSSDVAGAVLEVQEGDFTQRFGGSRVTRSEIVDLDDANPRATIVADLRAAVGVESAQFDCIILTQTLHVIDDMRAVLRECHRLLKPGGILLATLPCASRVCLEYGQDGDLWRVTAAGARSLFDPVFGPSNVATTEYGSVLTNVAFQHGLACDDLTDADFAARDPYHPLIVGVRARKALDVASPARVGVAQGVVLLYHRVADVRGVHDLAVPQTTFEDQLAWLARNCHVMPLEQMLTEAGSGLPERAVAITFDDGYLDTLECAAPILERAGIPATVFATTRWLDEPGEYWWDVLERAFLDGATQPNLTVEMGTPRSFSLETAAERRAAHDALHQYLVHASLETRSRVVSEIVSWAGLTPDTGRRPLVADELSRLARMPGISIGAHSVNHLALPDQSAPVQEHEMMACARDLERVLGRPVNMFAFPYGAVDRRSVGLSRQYYRWSATCEPAPLVSCFDVARVPRCEVKGWEKAIFADRIERMFVANCEPR